MMDKNEKLKTDILRMEKRFDEDYKMFENRLFEMDEALAFEQEVVSTLRMKLADKDEKQMEVIKECKLSLSVQMDEERKSMDKTMQEYYLLIEVLK